MKRKRPLNMFALAALTNIYDRILTMKEINRLPFINSDCEVLSSRGLIRNYRISLSVYGDKNIEFEKTIKGQWYYFRYGYK